MAAIGSIAKWYVAKLKTYPVITNVSSAFVLMTTGDVLAQELEAQKRRSKDQHVSVEAIDRDNTDNFSSMNHRHPPTEAVIGTSPSVSTPQSIAYLLLENLLRGFSGWDATRTMTMAAWSVCIYTPFYVSLFRLYDRYLPKQTPASIAARVTLSFLTSVPVNAAFYTYGAAAHQAVEWLGERRKLKDELEEMGLDCLSACQAANSIPFPEKAFWAKAQHKLEHVLPDTVAISASCWIPFNLFTFTMVPSHLRPVSLMVFSAFWNCYLSLSQHSVDKADDAVVEDGLSSS